MGAKRKLQEICDVCFFFTSYSPSYFCYYYYLLFILILILIHNDNNDFYNNHHFPFIFLSHPFLPSPQQSFLHGTTPLLHPQEKEKEEEKKREEGRERLKRVVVMMRKSNHQPLHRLADLYELDNGLMWWERTITIFSILLFLTFVHGRFSNKKTEFVFNFFSEPLSWEIKKKNGQKELQKKDKGSNVLIHNDNSRIGECLRSYPCENTRSHPNSEVKHMWAGLVEWWVTTFESPVLKAFLFSFFFFLFFFFFFC